MPFTNPFTSVTGKHAYTYFDIRLENDFIVFRGNEHESAGQLLQGTVVLCLPAPLKIEDVHLRLTGTLHMSWNDPRVTAAGISNHKIDRTTTVYSHRWKPFVGVGSENQSISSPNGLMTRGVTLPAGNYEWPFELMLPGDMTESVEGLREASLTYKLKATVARGKLAYDLHAYKRLRIIRTLDPSTLEFLHTMSVENIWPNKVEYSIMIPKKAVVFGSTIPLSTRFTPLLKGLELGEITIRLLEVHEFMLQSHSGYGIREHKKEREISVWKIPIEREKHWQDIIEDTGQEGWVMNTGLDLPRTLGKCVQDVNAHGIKVRHKLKVILALHNPDGHVSELRATLPVSIFISPNMPLDEEGNLVRQMPNGTTPGDVVAAPPPSYDEHTLDQLYEDMEPTGLQTPAGMASPLYGHSRAGSVENLAALLHSHSTAVPPAALTSRLQSMSLEPSSRSTSWHDGDSEAATPNNGPADSVHSSALPSAPLTRQNSDDNIAAETMSGYHTPEHLDFSGITELSKVPSYHTAVKTPVRPIVYPEGTVLPDYVAATGGSGTTTPGSPDLGHSEAGDGASKIEERNQFVPEPPRRKSTRSRLAFTLSHIPHIHHSHSHHGHSHSESEDRRRHSSMMQAN